VHRISFSTWRSELRNTQSPRARIATDIAAATPTANQSSSSGKNAERYRPKIPVRGLNAAQKCSCSGRLLVP
jgi:hypothetical protein